MKNKIILIVEDDQLLNEAYAMILNKERFKTLQANDGLQALEIIKNHPVDLILLDLRMPKMSGLGFLKYFKNNKEISLPKTIVFSNYDLQKDIDKAFKLGATHYMLKAWASPKELVKIVKDTLASKK